MGANGQGGDELFPLVDEQGRVLGSIRRSQAHGDPRLLHPVVHCLISSADDRLLLQRRSLSKDIQPGRWDTSVGGHVSFGETIEAALERELAEELGLVASALKPRFLYRYLNQNAIESELVSSYLCQSDGPFVVQASEIDEVRFWSHAEITAALGNGALTPNFEDEFARLLQQQRQLRASIRPHQESSR